MINNKNSKSSEVEKVPPGILDAAARGELIIFIGAGVSKIVGCPLWQEFAEKMLEDLYAKHCINFYEYQRLKSDNDFRKILSICKKIYEEKNIKSFDFKTAFNGNQKLLKKFKDVFEDLYNFNAIYLTTNYDTFLDEILEKELKEADKLKELNKEENITKYPELSNFEIEDPLRRKIIYKKEDLLISNIAYKNIIHIHGNIKDDATMIITISDYINNYQNDSELSFLLSEIFEKFTVLFIGYGLDEYSVLDFIISKTQSTKKEIRHYMLYPVFESEKNLLKFQQIYYKTLGVKLIPFSIDKDGYNALAKIIKIWAKQIGLIAKPQQYLERIRFIDEVVT